MPINQLNVPAIHGAALQAGQMQRQNALADMTMKKTQEFSALAPQIAAGDEAATRAGAAIAPQDTVAIMSAVSKMGEAERANKEAIYEEVGKAAAWADTPEKWSQAIDFLNSKGGGGFEQYRGQFANREMIVNNMREISDILGGKGKFGQPKAGIGPGGKPAFFQADPSGNVRGVEGFTPPPKVPLVSIENKQDDAVRKGLFEMDMETIKGTAEAVKAGNEFMPKLETIVQGLESGNVVTGRFQEATLPLRQWATSAGWYDDPDLGQEEAVLAAISFMIPRMRVPGSGQTSDVEISLFSKATAQYGNSPGGNILIARGAMQIQKWNKRLLAAQKAWLRKEQTLDGFDADKEIGTLFQHVKTQADLDSPDIPKGAVFIDDNDGRFKVKL